MCTLVNGGVTHPTLTSRPGTTTSTAWLLRKGQGATWEAPWQPWLLSGAGKNVANRSAESIHADADGSTPPTGAAGLGRVLVVDDEALVRRTLVLFLTKAGFLAVAVEGGVEALDLLRTPGETFDLLVTDQSMPGMTGRELIGTARGLCPGLSVLLVSGYDMSGGAEHLPGDISLLHKPVDRSVFLGRVRALLGLTDDEDGKGT